MKSKSSKRIRKPSSAPAAMRLEQMARTLAPEEWQRRTEALKDALAVGAGAMGSGELSHAECQEMLTWYVAAQQEGKSAQELYPPVYRHLQTCSRCAETYALMTRALDPKAPVQAAAARRKGPVLPFLHPSPGQAWYQQIAPQLQAAAESVIFFFNPIYLQNLFGGRTALALKSAEPVPAESLLLVDRMMVGEQAVNIEAFLIPSRDEPGRFHIHLRLSSATPLETKLRVRLEWGTQEYVAEMVAGEAELEGIAPPDFNQSYADEPSPEFRLTLEPSFHGPSRPD